MKKKLPLTGKNPGTDPRLKVGGDLTAPGGGRDRENKEKLKKKKIYCHVLGTETFLQQTSASIKPTNGNGRPTWQP